MDTERKRYRVTLCRHGLEPVWFADRDEAIAFYRAHARHYGAGGVWDTECPTPYKWIM